MVNPEAHKGGDFRDFSPELACSVEELVEKHGMQELIQTYYAVMLGCAD